MVWHNELAFHDLLVEVFIILSSEGEAATEESKQEHSAGPYVSGRPAELLLTDDLRSHIAGRSAENLDFLVVWDTCAESEVDYLNVALCVEHHVFELDISMAYALAVAVLQGADYLPIYPPCIILVHPSVRLRL